eukprot:344298-Prorocentrum_minimum.AAC.2
MRGSGGGQEGVIDPQPDVIDPQPDVVGDGRGGRKSVRFTIKIDPPHGGVDDGGDRFFVAIHVGLTRSKTTRTPSWSTPTFGIWGPVISRSVSTSFAGSVCY